MQKITYHYTALSKQTWFYSGILYLILMAIVSIQVEIYKIEGYYEDQNLAFVLLAYAIGIVFFGLLSLGHYVCYSEYDSEKITYINRLLHTRKTFYFDDAKAVFFDKRGIKFFKSNESLLNKEKPSFFIPFFRDGKVEPVPVNNLFIQLKDKEAQIDDTDRFKVYKSFKTLPGYTRRWKYISFMYACLTLLVILNCAEPAAVILGLFSSF